MKRILFIVASILFLITNKTYAQESRILSTEWYSTPFFTLSHFYNNYCSPLKIPSQATWNIQITQGDKSFTYKEDKPQKALFEIVEDQDSVYDCSSKRYEIATKEFTLEYSYYCYADALKIKWKGNTYIISCIDGCCCNHLGQLCQIFRLEGKKETLVLYVLDDIILTKDQLADATSITLSRGSILAISVPI